jgi:signal recognition particle subunit SRP54
LIKGNRKKRIAAGCGQELPDVNRILKQYTIMNKMMKKFKKGNLTNLMRGMKSNARNLKM